MKTVFQIFCALAIVLGSCAQSTNDKEKTSFKKDSDIVEDSIQTSTPVSASLIEGIVNSDSLIQVALVEDEKILLREISHLETLSDQISIWLIPVKDPMVKNYLLLLADTSKVLSFVKVKGVWIDNDETEYEDEFRFLSKPLIYREDITNDNQQELVIKDRQHIGNVYNAAVKHFFTLKNIEIKYLREFEYISHLPIEDKFLMRYWDTQTGIVDVFVKDNLQSKDSLRVGSYSMKTENDTLSKGNPKIILSDYEGVIFSTK